MITEEVRGKETGAGSGEESPRRAGAQEHKTSSFRPLTIEQSQETHFTSSHDINAHVDTRHTHTEEELKSNFHEMTLAIITCDIL